MHTRSRSLSAVVHADGTSSRDANAIESQVSEARDGRAVELLDALLLMLLVAPLFLF